MTTLFLLKPLRVVPGWTDRSLIETSAERAPPKALLGL